MRKIALLSLAIIFVVQSISFSSALTPTISGATGLVEMPTGDVLDAKEFNVGVDYILDGSAISGTTALTDLRGSLKYKVNMGSFMGSEKGMELGFVGRTDKATNSFKEGVFINMKYSLSSSADPDALRLAIGVENLTSSSESDVYLVASKVIKGGIGIHFGAMFDFPNNNKFRPLGMLGTNISIGSKNLEILGEAFAGESLFQLNAGLRFTVNGSFSLLARALNVTNNSAAKDVQSYSLGICLANFI